MYAGGYLGAGGYAVAAQSLYTGPDHSLLFDVASGSTGSGCGGTYFCTAGAGYDGPTGNGAPTSSVANLTAALPPPPSMSNMPSEAR